MDSLIASGSAEWHPFLTRQQTCQSMELQAAELQMVELQILMWPQPAFVSHQPQPEDHSDRQR